MATQAEAPIVVETVRDEERFLGGDVVWWLLLLIVGLPVLLWGLSQAPQIHGFLFMAIGGIAAGTAFAQLILRLPYYIRGFGVSLLIVLVASAVIAGVAFLFSQRLAELDPSAPIDVMFKPPVSGG